MIFLIILLVVFFLILLILFLLLLKFRDQLRHEVAIVPRILVLRFGIQHRIVLLHGVPQIPELVLLFLMLHPAARERVREIVSSAALQFRGRGAECAAE